jgi:hypothetical protein
MMNLYVLVYDFVDPASTTVQVSDTTMLNDALLLAPLLSSKQSTKIETVLCNF